MKSPATYWMCVLTGLVAAFALLLLADGCAVGPNYHRPKPDVPPAFRDAPVTTSTNSIGDLPWWEMFKDETLRGLIGQALTNNYDLAVASRASSRRTPFSPRTAPCSSRRPVIRPASAGAGIRLPAMPFLKTASPRLPSSARPAPPGKSISGAESAG